MDVIVEQRPYVLCANKSVCSFLGCFPVLYISLIIFNPIVYVTVVRERICLVLSVSHLGEGSSCSNSILGFTYESAAFKGFGGVRASYTLACGYVCLILKRQVSC